MQNKWNVWLYTAQLAMSSRSLNWKDDPGDWSRLQKSVDRKGPQLNRGAFVMPECVLDMGYIQMQELLGLTSSRLKQFTQNPKSKVQKYYLIKKNTLSHI